MISDNLRFQLDVMIHSFNKAYIMYFNALCKDTTLYTSGAMREQIGNPYVSKFKDDDNDYPVEIDPVLSSLAPYNIYVGSKRDIENAIDSLTSGESYNIPLTRHL